MDSAHQRGSDYSPGICPVVEEFHASGLFCLTAIYPPLGTDDMDDIIRAFEKVVRLSR